MFDMTSRLTIGIYFNKTYANQSNFSINTLSVTLPLIQQTNQLPITILNFYMTKTKTTIRQGANCNARLLASAVLALTAIVANAQQRVTGRVVDEHVEPVIGASVAVKGTGTGCVTDIDGRFTLAKVKPDQAIAVSYVGFATQTMTIGNNTSLTVTLKANDAVLDEVVVVGYGSITKRSVSTAMSTVKGASISDMPTSNVTQSLSGLSAGISLQQTSGEPGAAPSIRIRGAGSINSGNDPLYVIDGYPTTDAELFNNLNPSDIDDIQILKDAASSAIYGSKAGNGVIIVTTKRGKAGKPTVSLSTQVGISQVQRKVDVLEADDFLDMVIEARTNNGTINNYPDLVKLRESGNYCNTDWQDAIFRNALNYRANATVTGGNDVVTYSLSVNYQNEDGILLNSYFRKINIKAGFDAGHVKVAQPAQLTRNARSCHREATPKTPRASLPRLWSFALHTAWHTSQTAIINPDGTALRREERDTRLRTEHATAQPCVQPAREQQRQMGLADAHPRLR